jgi:hypothetical protein
VAALYCLTLDQASTRTCCPVPAGSDDGVAHLLIGLAHVNVQAHVQLDRLVELGGGEALEQRYRLFHRIYAVAIDLLASLVTVFLPCEAMFFSWWCYRAADMAALPQSDTQSVTMIPMLRAVPSIMAHGALDIHRVQIGHLGLGDLAHLIAGDGPHLLGVGLAEPLGTPAALSSRSLAGGVLVSKVKERS